MARLTNRFVGFTLSKVLLMVVVAPAIGLLIASFADREFFELWPDTWTVRWYGQAITGVWMVTILKSLMIASLGSALGVLATMPGAYLAAVEPKRRLTSLLHFLALLPALLPAITLTAGYYQLFGDVRLLALVGPFAALVVPITYYIQLYGFGRLGDDARAVARLAGASEWRVLYGVFVPNAIPQITLAWFLGVLFLLDEGVVSILLTEPFTRPFSKLVFETMTRERDPSAVAANVILTMILIGILMVFYRKNKELLKEYR